MNNKDTYLSKITQELGSRHFINLDGKIRKKSNKLNKYRRGPTISPQRNRSPQQCNEHNLKINTE